MKSNSICLLVTFIVAMLLIVSTALSTYAAPPTVRTVAVTGQPVPGLPTGVNWQNFTQTNLTDSGQVAFKATITGSGISALNNSGIWSEGLGALALVVREGQAVPGGGVQKYADITSFGSANSLQIDPAGQTNFIAYSGTDNNGNFFLIGRGGSSLQTLFLEPTPAIGLPAGTQLLHAAVSEQNNFFNSNGAYLTTFAYQGSSILDYNNTFLGSNRTGTQQTILREGSPAPGFPGAFIQEFDPSPFFYGERDFISFRNTTLTDNNKVAFSSYVSRLSQVAVPGYYEQALWTDRSGSLQAVAVTGDYEPSVPGFLHAVFSESTMNEVGQIAFSSVQRPIFGFFSNNLALWRNDSGTNRLILQNETPAPGMPAGVKFFTQPFPMTTTFVLSDSGKLVIRAILTGTGISNANDSSIWSEKDGILALEYQEGAAVPDISNTYFGDFTSTPLVSSTGSIAFINTMTGPGVSLTDNTAIWAEDSQGLLNLVARTGSLLQVQPGDLRTIGTLSLEGFNDQGQILYRADFTNGTSGLFVSDVVAIPEPSSIALISLAGIALLVYRRRQQQAAK